MLWIVCLILYYVCVGVRDNKYLFIVSVIRDDKHKNKFTHSHIPETVFLTERLPSVTSLIVKIIILVKDLYSMTLCSIERHCFVTEKPSQTLLSCYQI